MWPNIYIVEDNLDHLKNAKYLLSSFDWFEKEKWPFEKKVEESDKVKCPWSGVVPCAIQKKMYEQKDMWPSESLRNALSNFDRYPGEVIELLVNDDTQYKKAQDELATAPDGSFLILDLDLKGVPNNNSQVPAGINLGEIFLSKSANQCVIASRYADMKKLSALNGKVYNENCNLDIPTARYVIVFTLEQITKCSSDLFSLIRDADNKHPKWEQVKEILGNSFPKVWEQIDISFQSIFEEGFKQISDANRNFSLEGLIMIIAIVLSKFNTCISFSENSLPLSLLKNTHLKDNNGAYLPSPGLAKYLYNFFDSISEPDYSEVNNSIKICQIDSKLDFIRTDNGYLGVMTKFNRWPNSKLPLPECVLWHIVSAACKSDHSRHTTSAFLANFICICSARLECIPGDDNSQDEHSFHFGPENAKTIIQFSKPNINFLVTEKT